MWCGPCFVFEKMLFEKQCSLLHLTNKTFPIIQNVLSQYNIGDIAKYTSQTTSWCSSNSNRYYKIGHQSAVCIETGDV